MGHDLSSFKHFARLFVLCTMLGGGLATVTFIPFARAGGIPVVDAANNTLEGTLASLEAAAASASETVLGNIAVALQVYSAAIVMQFEKLLLYQGTSGALQTAGELGEVKAKVKIAQAEIDGGVKSAYLRTAMRVASQNVPPEGNDLCNAILVQQLGTTTEQFEKSVARLAASADETMYRTATSDGAGPEYAKDHYALRCAAKFGNKVDFPSACVDESTKGTDGRKIGDADISFSTLDGGQVLELPSFDTVTVDDKTYRVPNPQNTAQKFWTAGLYYCENLGGPRPSPPYGKELDTPDGRTAAAQWRQCQSRRSQLIQPCMNLLAYNTRPNSNQTALIATQQVGCKAAKLLNMTLPDDFEDCAYGLSPRQADLLQQGMCKNPQYYIAQLLGGGKHKNLLDVITECAASWSTWKEGIVDKEVSVYSSIDGLFGLNQCWASIKGGDQ